MRTVVIGAGAMGSIYGAMLHDAGNEVFFLDSNPAVVDAIEAHGAIITRHDGKEEVYRIPATVDAKSIDAPVDLILVQVKGFATAGAAQGARSIVGPQTIILTLQNGFGNEKVLREAYPDNVVLIGVSVHSVAMTAPGRYHHTGVRATWLGPANERWYEHAADVGESFERLRLRRPRATRTRASGARSWASGCSTAGRCPRSP